MLLAERQVLKFRAIAGAAVLAEERAIDEDVVLVARLVLPFNDGRPLGVWR